MFWKKKSPLPEEDQPHFLEIERSVWFILIEFEVIGSIVQPWIQGSRGWVQTFVPAERLEEALERLDGYLPTQELRRVDTSRAIRYEPGEEDANIPGNYFIEPLQEAASTGECALGVFVVSEGSATSVNPLS
jgi:hypothetical protein